MGVKIHILHGDGGSQHIHVPVEDVSPVSGHRRAPGLIVQRLGGIIIKIMYHQLIQPQADGHKGGDSQHQCRRQHPPMLTGADAQTVKLLFPHNNPPIPGSTVW